MTLTVLWLLPLVGGLLIAFMPPHLAKYMAVLVALGSLTIAGYVALSFEPGFHKYQFTEAVPWIPQLHVFYRLGVDGISLWLVVLNAFLTLIAVLATPVSMKRASRFIGLMLFAWSLFVMLMIGQGFFSSAIYTVVGPYMSEIWPARLRSSGMGLGYGVGNLSGKVLGPFGLALIMGAGDIIKPAAPNLVMLGPAFVYFASWYLLGVVGFWVFGPETKGRTLEEMDSALGRPAVAVASASRAPAE